MSIQEDILSFMDLLDLDEELIDTRLKSIMAKETYSNKHLKNVIQLLQYKQLINLQENTECDNEEECTFLVKLINQLTDENAVHVCKITNIALSLNSTTLVNKSEHLLQQILSDIDVTSEKTAQEVSTLLTLQLCDSMLDAVIKTGEKLALPFQEIPVSSIISSTNEKLRAHFLTSTVPKLFEGVEGFNILDVIWNFVKEIPDGNKELALRILSCLSEYYLPVADGQGKVSLQSEVVYQVAFWKIILFGLHCNNSMNRKLSVYLGKRAIDCLTTSKRNMNISEENKIFSWNSKKAGVLKNEWDDFFVLMDSLEEKQSNIVLPSLHLFEKLTNLEKCWLNCPFNLGLQHDNTQVRLKCIMYKFDTSLKSLNEAIMLLEALNDNNIFDDVIGYEKLKYNMTLFFSNEIYLNNILNALVLVKWSPVPLYHISDVLAGLNLKGFQLENGPQILNEILKTPCNNVLLRKAVHTNIFNFIENCCDLHWKDIMAIIPLFQVTLPNDKLFLMIAKNLVDNEKVEFLKSILELKNNDIMGILIYYLDKRTQDIPLFIQFINEKLRIIQDIVNRQYSNKKECFIDAISLATLYSKTRINSTNMEIVNKALSQEIKLIAHYLLSLISSDVTFDIEEVSSISKTLKNIGSDVPKENLLQIYKISLLLFNDERSHLDKTLLGLFVINSLSQNPLLRTHYKHEMINIKKILQIKNLNNKQNSRFVNVFYEKLTETVFEIVKEDKTCSLRDILEFIEKVIECGGYGCLYWILKIINEIIPLIFSNKDLKFDITQFVHRMWKEIEELKSNNQYGPCIEEFINLITQESLLDHPLYNNVVTLYCNRVIENGNVRNTPLYHLVRKLMTVEINMNRGHLVYILCEILMYAPVPRKDQRITDNLMIEILKDPRYKASKREERVKDTVHFNFQIQYSAISILSRIKHDEIYQTITSYITDKIDVIFKNKQRYHGNSQPHRSLLVAVQHLLCVFMLRPSLGDMDRVRGWCEEVLAKLPHQPSVRLCLEWFIALYYFTKGITIDSDFISHLDSKMIPLTSQFIIIYYIMKRKCKNNCSEQEYNFVLTHLLSNTMGPTYNVRLYAQCISNQLYKLKESPELRYTMELVQLNCSKDKNYSKLEQDFFISRFDIINELTPSFIYYFVANYTEINNEKIYFELVKQELDIVNEFVRVDGQLKDDDVFRFVYPKNGGSVVETVEGAGSIQKKYIPWRSMSDVEVYEIGKKKDSTSELIVVASLIDKLPNLGGMARTSEVFGVSTYVVDSLRHLQDRQFQALSVSAESWVNIEEVRPGAPLKRYLQARRAEGYVIVAAEQTSNSCQLNKYRFSKKTVLLLGHEKEGVPCDLLPLMDHCVEVPQQGVVRSLNVHVTAAIFIWEYSRQHLLS